MNRLKGRMLAVALAVTTLLSSAAPGTALVAEPVEADTSAEAYAVSAETEPAEGETGEANEDEEVTAEGSGADEADVAEEYAAEENGEEAEPADGQGEDPVEGQEDKEDADGGAEGEGIGETAVSEAGSGEGATGAAPSEPAEEGGETAAPADEEEKEPVKGEEETATGRFAVRFDSEGGIVRVIVSTDEGADEDEPSYELEKSGGSVHVQERNGKAYDASMAEGYALDIEAEAGARITVIADAEEGYHVSQYTVAADSGGEESTGFDEAARWFSHTASVDKEERKVFSVGFEKDEEEKKENGTVALKVGSEGGTVTVSTDSGTYTAVRSGNGPVTVTDQNGAEVDLSAEGYDLVVEEPLGSKVTVKAVADKGNEVTAFSVTGNDGAEEETGFDAGESPLEYEKAFDVEEGKKTVNVAFVAMPEFSAEKRAGKYIVKIHAEEGVLPRWSRASVREMSGADAEPYAAEAEKMAESGKAMAVFDIRFTDFFGREIQPNGMVEVTFEDAAEEDSAMSVFHAREGDAARMEEIPASVEGSDVSFRNDMFSPYVLLAASEEPDWTKGGKGTRTDVSDQIQFKQTDVRWFQYKSRGLGTFNTASYTMKIGDKTVGYSVCMDPRKDGDGVTESETVYEVTAPMLIKAVYYGFAGPGKETIRGITGTTDEGTNNIITHVAVAEIYARMGYTSKSSTGDGFKDTTDKLKELVKKYVKALEDLPVPENYYLYVSANSNGAKQDFGFGSYELVSHPATFKIQKTVDAADNLKARIESNKNYSVAGAVYGVYNKKHSSADAYRESEDDKIASLYIKSNGYSESLTVDPGTYYIVELTTPTKRGYILSNTVQEVTFGSGDSKVIEAKEKPKYVWLRIIKEPKNLPEGMTAPSLEGAVFEVYSDTKRDKEHFVGTLTTGADGKTEQLRVDQNGDPLPVQTYYVKEVSVPTGYRKVGNFSIDTSDALKEAKQYTLIDRTVLEPVVTGAGITIYKESSDPDITEGNSCYSLEGAKFGIYTDADCSGEPVEVIVTNSEGVAETSATLPVQDYWIMELEAPEGFYKNGTIFEVPRESLAQTPSQEITVNEDSKTDPAQIRIVKRAAGDVRANSLEGVEFTFSYYDGYYNSESELPDAPARSWTIKTKLNEKGEYVASFADCVEKGTFVEGDEFYLDHQGYPTFPLGTVTIEETRAAEGYLNDPDFGDGATMMIGQVRLNSAGEAKFFAIQGTDPVSNTATVVDSPFPPSISTSAVDAEYRTHFVYAGSEDFKIIDTVTYEYLNKDTAYTMRGTLMDKGTGEPFTDADGNEVTAETSFTTGDMMDGTVDVIFEFKSSEEQIEGHTLVVKEELVPDESNEDHENIPGAEHWDPDDEEQTIYVPGLGTSLVEKESGEKFVPADADVELVDTVSYENLVPGLEYSVTGTLMDKSTGKPLQYDGKDVTAETAFTPDTADGTVEVTFTFNTTDFEGKSIVAYEVLTYGRRTVAKHEDINDEGQTVVIPGVETNASDKETGKKNSLAAKDRIIVDEVTYTGLIPGKTYEVSGEVKIRPEGSTTDFDDAETVPSEIVAAKGEGSVSFDAEKVTFVPAGNEGELVSGILYVSFRVDASELAGEEMVVGETVRHNGVEIAVHRDIDDHDQTVKVPDGHTIAVDTSTGIKNTLAAENRIFKDTFSYENLLPGETYRFTGKVMADAGTDEEGSALVEEIDSVMTDEKGTPVGNGYAEFVPEEENGTLDLYFAIDASALENRDVTVFEKVTLDGNPVIVHEVLDGTQTVYVPEGRTTAVDSETKDQVSFPDEEVCILDTLKYKNLIPGKEYTVKGRIMRKSTGDELPSSLTAAAFKEGSGGSISAAEDTVAFIPDQEEGEIELTFVIDASALKGEDVVVFERVYHNGSEVIVHENIDDEDQTVHFPDGHTLAGDPDTNDRTVKAEKDVKIKDVFVYENLLPGKQYAISGKVMLKPLGSEEAQEVPAVMTDAEGNEIEEYIFIPEAKDGNEEVNFIIDASGLAGRSVVVFETMDYISTELEIRKNIVVHEDINDENETIHFPDGGTTAKDLETLDHVAMADEEVTVLDEVTYRNLIPGKMYTVTGTMMAKSTGEALVCDGKEVTATKEFTPEEADGSIILEFTFNGSALAGETTVVFETVYSNGKEVFVHADLNDEDQTVHFPDGGTTAKDLETQEHVAMADEEVTILDEVAYRNLLPGKTYTVTGTLMVRSTGEALVCDGKEVTAAKEFTPKEADGSVVIEFTFNGSALAGESVVAFEDMTLNGKEVFSHTDLEDEDQTVNFPGGGTAAADSETGSHTANADEEVTILDEVTYRNLIPGKTYTVTGTLMVRSTGEALVCDGKEVTATKEFTPKEADGSVVTEFTFNGSALAGESVVAFETVTLNGKEVFSHTDIEDEDQTVNFPGVLTTATDRKDGDHELSYKGTVTVVDDVKYTNLIPGMRYRVSGVLMNKTTGKPAMADGREITGETVFTAEGKNGSVEVIFTFDASKLGEGTYVVFETLYEINARTSGENEIGSHRDLTDASQTVKRPETPHDKTPRTGDNSSTVIWLIALMAAAAGITGAVLYRKKRSGK